MTFGGIKKYYLIHLDFHNDMYQIWEYEKDRRLTSNQAWRMIRYAEPILSGKLNRYDTVFKYEEILREFCYDKKYCDRYCTFRCF